MGVMTTFIGEKECNTVIALFCQSKSTEHQQFLVLYIGYSRHQVDVRAHHWTIDHLSTPKLNTQKEKH
jgi:hypothetical protein